MTDTKKIHCNICKHETNHELLGTHDKDYHEADGHALIYYENTTYGFWVCKGCDTASLEEKFNCSGMHDEDGDVYSYEYFPERKNKSLRVAKKFAHIDSKLNSVYLEIIKSHEHGLGIISAIGVRALLEGICIEEGIVDSVEYSLTGKILKLKEQNNIPESIIEGLNSLKFIGDNAAHRLDSSNNHTLTLAIDLLEALLVHLYEAKFDLQRKAELVKNAHNN